MSKQAVLEKVGVSDELTHISPYKSPFPEQVRSSLTARHYSQRTVEAYIHWMNLIRFGAMKVCPGIKRFNAPSPAGYTQPFRLLQADSIQIRSSRVQELDSTEKFSRLQCRRWR